MPISITYDPETCLLLLGVSGVVTIDVLRRAVVAIAERAAEKPLSGIVFDQSGVTDVDMKAEEVREIADVTRGLEAAQGMKMANVAPEDVAFGMSRMYELVRDDGENVRTFRDRESALRWLVG